MLAAESHPPPGRPSRSTQAVELGVWQSNLALWDQNLAQYQRLFPFNEIAYDRTRVLDVGSGPISVFEKVAPASAQIVPYDTLGDEYNKIATDKRFPITHELPSSRFGLITIFNTLDHMDQPSELLDALTARLEGDGTLWIYCHIGRPYAADAHPQDFRFWQLILLVDDAFRLRQCGLVREGRLFPYAWWCVCGARGGASLADWPRRLFFIAICGAQFARFHFVRACVKAVKLVGLRRLLPAHLRF